MDFWQQQFYIDLMAKKALDSIGSPTLDTVMVYITNLGAPLTFYILAAGGVAYFAYKQKLIEGLFLVLCLFTSWGTMNLLKLVFMRARPAGEQLTFAEGYSFPSGHATLSLAFYGFIIYLLLTENKDGRTKFLAGFIAVLIFIIGISRVYLNVHYATDVLAGFILGSILLALFILTLRYCKSRFYNKL